MTLLSDSRIYVTLACGNPNGVAKGRLGKAVESREDSGKRGVCIRSCRTGWILAITVGVQAGRGSGLAQTVACPWGRGAGDCG